MPAALQRLLLVSSLLFLAACGHGKSDAPAPDQPPTELPDGAIKLRDGYYMVPLGLDADGCRMYRPFAPGMLTDQAIRYRRADDSFTMAKEEAACEGRD